MPTATPTSNNNNGGNDNGDDDCKYSSGVMDLYAGNPMNVSFTICDPANSPAMFQFKLCDGTEGQTVDFTILDNNGQSEFSTSRPAVTQACNFLNDMVTGVFVVEGLQPVSIIANVICHGTIDF
jgi:hypothetical protein